jgi:hypothetical protein
MRPSIDRGFLLINMERKAPPHPRREPDLTPPRRERKRRAGSRFLLAAALVGGVIGAFYVGAGISDVLCDLLGVTSTAVRLGAKVAIIAVAIPAGFYLVERFFLSRSSRGGRNRKKV